MEGHKDNRSRSLLDRRLRVSWNPRRRARTPEPPEEPLQEDQPPQNREQDDPPNNRNQPQQENA